MKKTQQQQQHSPLDDMQTMFEEAPPIKYGDSLGVWKSNGPVELQQWLEQGLITLDTDLKTVIDEEMNEKG